MTTIATPAPGSLAARMDAARARRHAIVADRRELARLELIANARQADLDMESETAPTRAVLRWLAAEAQWRVRQARTDAALRPLGSYGDGPRSAGRDARRAAVHAERTRQPITASQRSALARQLADGVRLSKIGGKADGAVVFGAVGTGARQGSREDGLITVRAYGSERIDGQDARRGVRGDGITHYLPHPAAMTLPNGLPLGGDLTVVQDGRVIVQDGTVVSERDASRDQAAHWDRVSAARLAGVRVRGSYPLVVPADFVGPLLPRQYRDGTAASVAADMPASGVMVKGNLIGAATATTPLRGLTAYATEIIEDGDRRARAASKLADAYLIAAERHAAEMDKRRRMAAVGENVWA